MGEGYRGYIDGLLLAWDITKGCYTLGRTVEINKPGERGKVTFTVELPRDLVEEFYNKTARALG